MSKSMSGALCKNLTYGSGRQIFACIINVMKQLYAVTAGMGRHSHRKDVKSIESFQK